MNKKRIVALLAAATMLVSTVPVFGAESTASSVEVTGAATGFQTIVTGNATVNDVDKNVPLKVTLPTARVLKFTVDPHNLISATGEQGVIIDLTATGEGAIIAPEDALAVIKNMSNVPVKVDATFSVTHSATGLNLVTEQSLVAVATDANMFLAVVPSTQKAWDASTYVTTNEAIAVESAGTKVSYKLAAAEWETIVSGDAFVYRQAGGDENFDAVAFKMGGSVNKAADWSTFMNNLEYKVVFDVQKAASSLEWETNTSAYHLASGSALTTEYTPVSAVAATPATVAYAGYNAKNAVYFIAVDSALTKFASNATITNAKANGVPVQTTFDGYVGVTAAQVTSASEIVFTFEVNGEKYTATYTAS